MSDSDEFGLADDDTAFITVATQVELSQPTDFAKSPRPAKRRRLHPTSVENQRTPSSDRFQSTLQDDERLGNVQQAPNGGAQAHQTKKPPESEADDDLEYHFPGELPEADDQSKRQSKYKIHVPRKGGYFADQIFTQTQANLDDSPGRFRGAVWKRPLQPPPAPPVFGLKSADQGRAPSVAVAVAGCRQTTLSGFANRSMTGSVPSTYQSDVALAASAARLQAKETTRSSVAKTSRTPKLTSSDTQRPDVFEELADLPSDAFESSPIQISDHTQGISGNPQVPQLQHHASGLRAPQQGLKQMTIFGQPATQDVSASQAGSKKYAWPMKSRDEAPTHHKLKSRAMESWVYPTNLGATRDYQYNIVSRSLFHNTLVALPTGLGKTFIAATVMLNYYRWTSEAQIVFMAPTKPLIAQQMEACYGIVGIPRRDTVLMTGETTPALRAEEWLEKRVFFMTPQTVINDLKTGICDPKKLVLVVVDEAHKATGGYAYTEVIKFLRRFNNSFRVQALTATPGSTVEAVQAVIDNLGISRVELRTEQSLDIRAYTHEKNTDTQLFDFSDEQERIMELISQAIRPVLEKLSTQNAYWSRDPMQLTAYGLTIARQKWMKSDAGHKASFPIKGMVNTIFTVLSSLAHSIGLLKFHGIVPFHTKCIEFQQGNGKYVEQISQSEAFTRMMTTIRSWRNNADFIGHPKLEYLREVLLNHFLDAGDGTHGADMPPSATRVMVFAHYRDSAEEICRVLKRNEPMIRPHVFVGQASSKNSEGMDQKRQNAVIQDFKSGKYNTLIATSIGEEGLDIGTVDLIVCYDASSSPIRMLQRIGRTGRKRIGNVVLLLMKSKEENDYIKAQDNYAYIQKTIADPGKYNYHEDQSPRILPKEAQPVVDKRMIDIPPENSQPIDLNEKGRRAKGKGKPKRPAKKFHMPDGVRTGFVSASRFDSDPDDDIHCAAPTKTTKKTVAQPAKFRKPMVPPEPTPVPLPFLADVVLTREQQSELEQKYARTTGDVDDDIVIRVPDAQRFPAAVLQATVTKYVRRGKATLAAAKAMEAIIDMDDQKIENVRAALDLTYMCEPGPAKGRVVNAPTASNDDLPNDPLALMPAKKTPRNRSKKGSAARKEASSVLAPIDGNASRSISSTHNPCGRPRKVSGARCLASYGSAADEGEESSPDPTPANMRLGTQVIDLGSRDTSGEEEDDELDSELEDFVVRSDQPIEMASSSQHFLDDTQTSKAHEPPLRNKMARKVALVESESSETDDGLTSLREDDSGDESIVEEMPPQPRKIAPASRKRRVLDDSDDDE